MDNSKLKSSSISPKINGLSDHDAQILIIKIVYATINKFLLKQGTRLINNETITNFQTQLEKKETWEAIYKDTCSNRMSIAYLCTFLKIFEASFPLKYKGTKEKKDWITQGIKISCKLKEIFISSLRTAMIKEQKCVIYYIL